MAEIIGVTPAAICRWEKGERVISDWVIKSYSRYFGVPESYFTGSDEPILSPQEKRLLKYFRLLDEAAQEKYLEAMSGKGGTVSESDTIR